VSQEAISNIAKHAGAEQVLIQGQIREDVLTIEIEDDGKGFDPAVARSPGPDGHGWGLLGITERVDALGGHVEIDSAPDQGVRMVVTVTLPAETPRA
jgi:signal transduction histidine kinase